MIFKNAAVAESLDIVDIIDIKYQNKSSEWRFLIWETPVLENTKFWKHAKECSAKLGCLPNFYQTIWPIFGFTD